MSIPPYIYSQGRSRIDSALSLPLPPGNDPAPHPNMDRTVAPPPGPWSQVNRRNQAQQGSANWTPAEWLTPAPTFDENLATIESNLDLSFPDHETLSTSSPPPSPPFTRFEATTSSATDPSTLATSPSRDNTKIQCRQCDAEFTGVYKKGNHARHVRQKHTDLREGVYICKAEGCSRHFARPDARLKHARKHHPGLHPGPVHRRRGQYSSTSSVTESMHPPETYFFTVQESHQPTQLPTVPSLQPVQAWMPAQSGSRQWSQGVSHISGVEGSSTASTLDCSLDFDVGQWSSTPSQTCVSTGTSIAQAHAKLDFQLTSSVAILELPRAARIVFASLRGRVDAVTYSRICDNAFFRWEDDARRIRFKQPDFYNAYSKVLEDLYSVVDAIDAGAISPTDPDDPDAVIQSCRPQPGQPSTRRITQNGRPNNGGGNTSSIGNNTKPLGRVVSTSGPGNNSRVTKNNSAKKPEQKQVDCPEYKHCIMNNLQHQLACRGCRQVHLSQVRGHLNRVNHFDYVKVRQCRRCKTDFVDLQSYNLHMHQDTCQNQAQPRQDIVLPWARLYFARYPDVERIPIPFCDEIGWLDDSYLDLCRSMLPVAPASSNTPSGPFLDPHQGPIDPGEPLTPLAPNNPINEPVYEALTNFFLQDLLAPPHLRSSSRDARDLHLLVPTLNTNGPTAAQNFQRVLEGTSWVFFMLLAGAPAIISDEQRRETAAMLEVIAGLLRTYQRPQLHQFQPPVPSTPMPPYPQVQGNPTTPIRPSFLTTANGHRGSVGMSTRTSSQGFETASSQHRLSSYTDPSSLFDFNDPSAFEPTTTNDCGSWSRNPGLARSYNGNRASSATRSLRELLSDQGTVQAHAHDPTLLPSPYTVDEDYPDEFEQSFGPDTRDDRYF